MNGAMPTCPIVALAFLLLGAEPPEPVLYLDDLKPQPPIARIVSLAPSLTEILFALGLGDRVVGVTRFDDYPPEVAALPRVGGYLDPSVEAILALAPDLVVTVRNASNEARMRSLARLRVPVLVLGEAGLYDLWGNIAYLGALLGQDGPAAVLLAELQGRARAVAAKASALPRPRTLVLYSRRPFVAAGPGTFADEMLRLSGGENVLESARVRYPTIPTEELFRLSPAIIVDASDQNGRGTDARFWEPYRAIPAVAAGRVHTVDPVLFFRPGPRIVQGLERLLGVLHP